MKYLGRVVRRGIKFPTHSSSDYCHTRPRQWPTLKRQPQKICHSHSSTCNKTKETTKRERKKSSDSVNKLCVFKGKAIRELHRNVCGLNMLFFLGRADLVQGCKVNLLKGKARQIGVWGAIKCPVGTCGHPPSPNKITDFFSQISCIFVVDLFHPKWMKFKYMEDEILKKTPFDQ